MTETASTQRFTIDQKVIVQRHRGKRPTRRHFAGMGQDGTILVWRNGRTSWTASGPHDVTAYSHCEAAD